MSQSQSSAAEAAMFPYQGGKAPVQGMNTNSLACAYPSPTPRAQYCHPAPYTQVGGQKYHTLAQAYGQSRRATH